MKAIRIIPFVIFCFFTIEGFAKPLSPIDFGLKEAKTDIERYEVLLLTHTQAAKQSKAVSYKGIKQIYIEIPNDGRSIPISYKTDFAGVKIVVKNNAKNLALFELKRDKYEIILSKEKLIEGNFTDVNELRLGKKIVIIEDQTSWVVQRSGYF